jgi:L-amino acid N-acyltransferase YncA
MFNSEIDGPPPEIKENKEIKVEKLADFDMEYFKTLEGENGWIAIGQENCKNQKYYTVIGDGGEKLGIVGVYDTDDEQNLTHVVVDPKFRGQGLTSKFYEVLMVKENLSSLTATVDRGNIASARAHEKAGFRKVSDKTYEEEFDKVKYKLKNRGQNK